MFIEALFITAKCFKQPSCPSVRERKSQTVFMIKYYLAIKRNKLQINATTWINLKVIMLSEGSLTQDFLPKYYCMIPFT